MSRKILSLVVAVAFVLMTIGTAIAAPLPTDIAGTDYQKAVSKLQILNIMAGYPDGTFQPDKTIIRKEFAKIAVTALGLADAAKISAGTTKFADVAADDWASGYINVASSQGIITGYPDGTFKPEKEISYAEAITILAKMLGYAPVLSGKPWPAAYVTKAADKGITAGVALSPDAPASRGNVAKMMSNTLSCNMVYVDSYTDSGVPTYKDGDATKTILQDKLKLAKLADSHVANNATVIDNDVWVVRGTPAVQNGSTTSDTTFVSTTGGQPNITKGFIDGINPDDYLGLEVKAWYVNDTNASDYNKVKLIEVQTATSDIYTGIISKDDTKVKLEGLSKSYDTQMIDAGATPGRAYYVNGTSAAASASVSLANVAAALGQTKAKATVIFKDGKIRDIYAWAEMTTPGYGSSTTNWYESNLFVVKEVKDGYIKSTAPSGTDRAIHYDFKVQDLKDKIATKNLRLDVNKDGKAATLDDIKAGDIVNVSFLGGKPTDFNGYQRWDVTTATTATGTLSATSGTGVDATITIGDKTYTLVADYTMSTNGGSDYNKTWANITDIMGKSVTATVDANGQIVDLVSQTGSSTYYYGLFSSAAANAGVTGGDSVATLYKADGTKVTYVFDKSSDLFAYNSGAADLRIDANNMIHLLKGTPIQYKLTSDGKISQYSIRSAAYARRNATTDTAGNALDANYMDTNSDITASYVAPVFTNSAGANAYAVDSKIVTTNGASNAQVTAWVTSDTAAFNAYKLSNSLDDPDKASYDTLKSAVNMANPFTVFQNNGVIKFVSVDYVNATATTDGVVVSTGMDGDGKTVTINNGGTLTTYKYLYNSVGEDWAAFNGQIDKGHLVKFALSGGKIGHFTFVSDFVYNRGFAPFSGTDDGALVGAPQNATATSDATLVRITGVDTANKILKVKPLAPTTYLETGDEKAFGWDSSVKVYDATNKDAIVGGKSTSDLAVGDYVVLDQALKSTATVNVFNASANLVKNIVKIKKDDIKDGTVAGDI